MLAPRDMKITRGGGGDEEVLCLHVLTEFSLGAELSITHSVGHPQCKGHYLFHLLPNPYNQNNTLNIISAQ